MAPLRLDEPLALAEAGYWVFPLHNRKKFLHKLGGRTWGEFFEDPSLGHSELLARLAMAGDATGWGLVLQATDPVPLVVVDSDSYGITAEVAWEEFGLSGVVCPPYVRSASGGHHFWFRWDDDEVGQDASIDHLPGKFTLPGGAVGDIRASNAPRLLIVLPGTRAVGHSGKPGTYVSCPGFPDLDELPAFPRHLYRRLAFNETGSQQVVERDSKCPTEAKHLLDLLGPAAFSDGQMNIDVSKVGQILGRCLGWKAPSDELLALCWQTIKPLLDDEFDDRSFRQAIVGGWKTGAKNRQAHGAASDVPTATEVLDEAVRLFGGSPHLTEVLDSGGKTHEYVLGIGGSAKSPSGRACSLLKIEDMVEALTRLSGAELDVVTQSPLFVLGKWRKALHFSMMVGRAVDTLGISAEEAVWERLRALARGAASAGNITDSWRGGYPSSDAFVVASAGSTTADSLALRPRAYEALLLTSGDVAKARRLAKARGVEKPLTGSKAKLVCFSLADIQKEGADPALLDYIGAEIVRLAQRKAEKGLDAKGGVK